jgi:Transposase, Mutator family
LSSAILPPWARESPRIAEVLPLLYLHGLSTGDFVPALEQFLGSAAGLSPATVARLTAQWQADHAAFCERDLSQVDYVCVWADGVHLRIRLGESDACVLVLIGVRAEGTKELIAMDEGYRETAKNPIESTFATVRLRTKVTKKAGSRAAGPAMVFKLMWLHRAVRPSSPLSSWARATEASISTLRIDTLSTRKPNGMPSFRQKAIRSRAFAKQCSYDSASVSSAWSREFSSQRGTPTPSHLRNANVFTEPHTESVNRTGLGSSCRSRQA